MAPQKNKQILDDVIVFISFLNTIWNHEYHAIYKLTLKGKRTILAF